MSAEIESRVGRIADPSYDRSVADRWQFPVGRIVNPSHVFAAQ